MEGPWSVERQDVSGVGQYAPLPAFVAVGTAATPKVCMEVAARGQWSSKSCPGRIDGLVMLL